MESSKKKFVLHAQDAINRGARIKVVGIGGGGCNAVDHMVAERIDGVEFYVANTDAQALGRARTENKLQFGINTTGGHGAGFNPQRGREAALEDRQKLIEYIGGAEMIFLTTGLGGGTGTGATPVFAEVIKEAYPEALVIAVVTTPFSFEGSRRSEYAESGAKVLSRTVDSIITISNDKILTGDVPLHNAYETANDVLLNAVRGIADVIVRTGFINVDFADIQTIMSEEGMTMMGHGRASGERRAKQATEGALRNPLLAEIDISCASGILVNVTASSSISTNEYKIIGEAIQRSASNAKSIISGLVFDEAVDDEIRVTIIASGLAANADEVDEVSVDTDDVFDVHRSKFIGNFSPSRFNDGLTPAREAESEYFESEELDHAEEPEHLGESIETTDPFVDEPGMPDYEINSLPGLEQEEHVPSILRNRGHFKPRPTMNGSAEL